MVAGLSEFFAKFKSLFLLLITVIGSNFNKDSNTKDTVKAALYKIPSKVMLSQLLKYFRRNLKSF